MSTNYDVLGISPDADDETIRRRYLELTREHPPDRSPERFAAIRAAYEQLKDRETRMSARLFRIEATTLPHMIEEFACRKERPRTSLSKLIKLVGNRSATPKSSGS